MKRLPFWERVEELKKIKSFTYKELSQQTGIKESVIKNMIYRDIYPPVDRAASIATVLDTSLDYLFFGKTVNGESSYAKELANLKNRLIDFSKTLNKILSD